MDQAESATGICYILWFAGGGGRADGPDDPSTVEHQCIFDISYDFDQTRPKYQCVFDIIHVITSDFVG